MESLANYSSENKILFYRSRFILSPENDDAGEIWPSIICSLQGWLEEKEDDRSRRGKQSGMLLELTENIVDIAASIKGAKRKCYANQSLANGTFEAESEDTHIATRAVFSRRQDVPTYWALEYVEQDANNWYRRWFTSVGVTDTGDGSYIVNTRVAIADDPTFIRDRPYIPPRNTPRFIGWLLKAKGCKATSGNVELKSAPKLLTSRNFDAFALDLTDPRRAVPFVVMAAQSGKPGVYSVNPNALAKALQGTAAVYLLDCSDTKTRDAYCGVFMRNETTAKYRVNNGSLRVFFPGVDLSDPRGSVRHRFYTQEALETANHKTVVNDICGAFTRLYRRSQGEAVDFASIRAIKARDDQKLLEQRFHELEKTRVVEKPVTVDLEGLHSEEELKAAIEKVQSQADKQREEDAAFYNSYIETLEKENKRLHENAELESLEIQIANEDLTKKVGELEEKVKAKEHAVAELQTKAAVSAETAGSYQVQANIIRSLDVFPSTTRQALDLAGQAFAAELAITKEAEDSALEDGKNASTSEVFDILRALAVNLWPKYFTENEADTRAGSEFKNETGYEITFFESTMTNKDARLKNQRAVSYNGRVLDASPHVKGKSGARDRKLRVHFAVDRETRKIVICHCGAHKETAGTRKVK